MGIEPALPLSSTSGLELAMHVLYTTLCPGLPLIITCHVSERLLLFLSSVFLVSSHCLPLIIYCLSLHFAS